MTEGKTLLLNEVDNHDQIAGCEPHQTSQSSSLPRPSYANTHGDVPLTFIADSQHLDVGSFSKQLDEGGDGSLPVQDLQQTSAPGFSSPAEQEDAVVPVNMY